MSMYFSSIKTLWYTVVTVVRKTLSQFKFALYIWVLLRFYCSEIWQKIKMEQYLWYFLSRISLNRLTSFLVEVTHTCMWFLTSTWQFIANTAHPPFTPLLTKARITFAIKQYDSYHTSPSSHLNLEGKWLLMCISNTIGSLLSGAACATLRLSQEAESTLPYPSLPPQALQLLGHCWAPAGHTMHQAKPAACHWNHSKTHLNSVQMSTKVEIQR